MGAAAAGRRAVRPIEGRFPDDTDDLLGDDPFTGWETAADGALSAFAEDDALRADRAPLPRAHAGRRVHPRDDRRPHRARLGPRPATDGDTELDGELVTAALVFAEQLPEDGVPGMFDPPLRRPAVRAAADAAARPGSAASA